MTNKTQIQAFKDNPPPAFGESVLLELKNGVALLKRANFTFENKEYLVTHVKFEEEQGAIKPVCFWTSYDLDLETALNVFKEKTEKREDAINTDEELQGLAYEFTVKLDCDDDSGCSEPSPQRIEKARRAVQCSTSEYSVVIPPSEQNYYVPVDGGTWMGAAVFIPYDECEEGEEF